MIKRKICLLAVLSAFIACPCFAQVEEVNDAVSHTISLKNLAEKVAQGLDRIEEWEQQFEVLKNVKDKAEKVANTIRDVNTKVDTAIFFTRQAEEYYYKAEYLKNTIVDSYEAINRGLSDGTLSVDEATYMLDVIYNAEDALLSATILAKSAFTPDPGSPKSTETRKQFNDDSNSQLDAGIYKLEKPRELLDGRAAEQAKDEVFSQVFEVVHDSDKGEKLKANTSILRGKMSKYEKLMTLLVGMLLMFYTLWNILKITDGKLDFAEGVKHIFVSVIVSIFIVIIFAKIF